MNSLGFQDEAQCDIIMSVNPFNKHVHV